MSGSYPSKRLLETFVHHLHSFGLSLERLVICVVTDGVAVMKKMSKLSNTEYQRCYAHALHLAVCDLIYKHEDVDISDKDLDAEDNVKNEGLQIETNESGNVDFEDEYDEHLEENFALNVPDEEEPVLVPKINSVIKKVYATINIFNRSPQKNEILQRYVVLEHKKELALLRDCKTRNSMLSMIERFLLLLSAISKAFVDLSGEMTMNIV